MPGQQGPPGGGGRGGAPGGPPRIMLPNEKFAGGNAGTPGGAIGGGAAALVGGERPLPNRYRPPPGFMNDAPTVDESTASMPPDEMISKLRSRAGHWFQLARLFPALTALGYDSNSLDELTGITPAEQNLWLVASTVYDSLVASDVAPELLRHFESGGDALLYHFRFLPVDRRVDAARYIQANGLDAPVGLGGWGVGAAGNETRAREQPAAELTGAGPLLNQPTNQPTD
jgi:hypothetical protein